MKYYYLNLYQHFACLAADCPDTCCRGWRILVDEEAMTRFSELPDLQLREDVLSHICKDGDSYFFENQQDGRCSMLDEDGLCRLQRRTNEHTLCVTCRKFPRLAGTVDGDLWMSMAASCPVTAQYLLKNCVRWYVVENQQTRYLDREDIAGVAQQSAALETLLCSVRERCRKREHTESALEQAKRQWTAYLRLEAFVSGCLDLLEASAELPYLEGGFDHWAQEFSAAEVLIALSAFCGRAADEQRVLMLRRFERNYLDYRMYSRFFLCPGQSWQMQGFCALGELLLFLILRFSRWQTMQTDKTTAIVQEICWMYRFCAHGTRRTQGFLRLLSGVFNGIEDLAEILIEIFGRSDATSD